MDTNEIIHIGSYVAVDIETTGFSQYKDKILQIAAVKFKDGQVVDKYNEYINPGIHINSAATRVNGITNDMVTDKDTYEKVIPRFADFIKDNILVFHNANFDYTRFLKHYSEQLGIQLTNKYYDTLEISRIIVNDPIDNYQLGTLCDYYKISLENKHNAFYDAQATGILFAKLKQNSNLDFETNFLKFPKENNITLIQQTLPSAPTATQSCKIRQIAYWEKHELQRIYITTNQGVVYYDIKHKQWGNKNADNINFAQLGALVIEKLGFNSCSDLCNYKETRNFN